MKHLRLLPFLALVLAIGFSAFTEKASEKAATGNFYRFTPSVSGDELVESAYEYVGTSMPNPTGCSIPGELPCIIEALGDENQPDFQASGIVDLEDLEQATVETKD